MVTPMVVVEPATWAVAAVSVVSMPAMPSAANRRVFFMDFFRWLRCFNAVLQSHEAWVCALAHCNVQGASFGCWPLTLSMPALYLGYAPNQNRSLRSRKSRSEEHTSELQSPCNL